MFFEQVHLLLLTHEFLVVFCLLSANWNHKPGLGADHIFISRFVDPYPLFMVSHSHFSRKGIY